MTDHCSSALHSLDSHGHLHIRVPRPSPAMSRAKYRHGNVTTSRYLALDSRVRSWPIAERGLGRASCIDGVEQSSVCAPFRGTINETEGPALEPYHGILLKCHDCEPPSKGPKPHAALDSDWTENGRGEKKNKDGLTRGKLN